jgi:cytosine/uracil/thiamine/allantoin permease
MDPVPPDMRTWTTFNYVMYWLSDAANVGMWALASSMLAIGLSWYGFLHFALRVVTYLTELIMA